MKRLTVAIAGLTAMSLASAVMAQDEKPTAAPRVPSPADPDIRAAGLLAQMTPEERRALLHGPMPALMSKSRRAPDMVIGAGYIPGVPRLGIPALRETDASLGVANLANVRTGDVATALPSGLALASAWDPALIERGSAMIGSEARAKGFNVMLAGGINLTREPRNGRNFEYLGEDPLLAGTLGGHAIRGVQSNNIISTVKHFALNAQETGRNVLSVDMDEAAMRESDLFAFEKAIEIGNPGSVMCAYNRVNGVYACENDFLLNQVLRRDWNYKGWVISDWGAVHSTEALLKGLDQQSGEQVDLKPFFGKLLDAAVAEGRIPAAAVDRAALRILRTMAATGVLDHPAPAGQPIDYDAHARVAQDAAESGLVLLKNDRNLLPLAATARRIVLIGKHVDIGVLSGGGSSQVRPVGGPALEYKPKGLSLAASFGSVTYVPSAPLAAMKQAFPQATITFDDGTDPARAAAAAKDADLVVIIAEQWTTEAEDVRDLSLPDGQDTLISAVADVNPRVAVVLTTGGPVLMPWLTKVGAVIEAWYPGQSGATAIARVLSGAVNPSGRLPITFPAAISQLPNAKLPGSDAPAASASDRATYGLMVTAKPFDVTYPEGADVGYRWYDRHKLTPLFAFGHGLSYTRFRYGKLKVTGGRTLKVSFDVTNTGARAGSDVAQVYGRGKGTGRLVGWQKVTLNPGETRQVSITADRRALGRFDVPSRQWRLDGGTYRVAVGASATDQRLQAAVRLDRGAITR